MNFIRNRPRLFGYVAAGVAAIGMVGYVGGRFIAATDARFVEVVYVSTYLVLAGFVLAGLLFIAVSPASRRPFIPRAFAAVMVVFGILLALFPYSRAVAYPGAVLAAAAILLLMIGWKDLCEPRVWSAGRSASVDARK